MSSARADFPDLSRDRSPRLAGILVLLYLFSHSYYAVGSLRNAFGSGPQDLLIRTFALLHGIAATGLFMGSLLLLLKKRRGLRLARAAAGMLALVGVVGGMVFWKGAAAGMFGVLLVLSQPVYPLFLFLVLPLAGSDAVRPAGKNVWTERGLLLLGALLPWAAALFPGAPMSSLRPALGLFMIIWSALPFLAVIITARILTDGTYRVVVMAGGGSGTAFGSLYAYSMLWAQGGDSFLMALFPPIVFAAQALGIVIALGIRVTPGFIK